VADFQIELKKEAMQGLEYLKEPNESMASLIERAFKLLYYFQKQQDEGFTQVFLRNPVDARVKRMRFERANS